MLDQETRKYINYKWMQEEANNKKYMIINNFKVFEGLPIICKKTMTINKTDELKNNEEFEVFEI